MRASFVIGSALFSVGFSELLAPSPATSDPTITPAPQVPVELFRKQNDDRFMGWINVSGKWTTRQCDLGGTYYQSGDYWRCCATTAAGCNVPIGCVDGSMVYSFSTGTQQVGTYACTDIYTDSTDSSFSICNTGFMFQNSADSDPRTNVFCGVSSLNWSYYRVEPEEATPTPSSTSSSTPSSPRSTAANPTGASATTSASPEPEPKKGGSKAWIAGAVVGPIVGLAILGALLWFCCMRRKKKTQTTPAPAQGAPPVPGAYQQQGYQGSPSPHPSAPYQQHPPQMQQNQANMVPFGVAKHDSWAPQSPHTQGSASPQPQHNPYGPSGAQQWQPSMQQQSSPQSLSPQPNQQQMYPSPPSPQQSPHSPAAPPYVDNGVASKQPHVAQHSQSYEMDGTAYQKPAAT